MPPIFYRLKLWDLYNVSYFWLPICHQLPSRSFFLWGTPLALGARCFGIYSGMLATLMTVRRPITPMKAVGMGIVPVFIMLLEIGLSSLRVIEVNNLIRLVLGIGTGVGLIYLLEAFQSMLTRNRMEEIQCGTGSAYFSPSLER
jgi:uncharacterized membrane protein